MRWTSHRGLCLDCVENTRGSFEKAIKAGFTCLETDLRCTKDDVIVLHHDRSLKRTAGHDLDIDHITVEQFRGLSFSDGQKGLTFDEFVDDFAGFSWIFDIKPETAGKVIRELRLWCERKRSEDWLMSNCRFLMWSADDELMLKQEFPNAVTLARESECRKAGVSLLFGLGFMSGIKKGRVYALPPKFFGLKLFKKSFIEKYQRRGAKVLAYLPEESVEITQAINAGVDEILTNGKPCIQD